ncbi:MAG: hypothetical protein U0841_16835 [Chloroflexia bacterium]
MATEDQIANLLERLVGIPERIAGVVAGWDMTTLRTPGPDGRSAAQIRPTSAPATTSLPRASTPSSPATTRPRRLRRAPLGRGRRLRQRPLRPLVTTRLRRQELVSTLSRIAPADWGRIGTHEEHGPITLQAVAEHLVAHEEEHCAQLRALLPF